MEVRTGKTMTALDACKNVGANNVLFVTKKKAMSSILNDYKLLEHDYNIEVINYESVHKHTLKKVDLMIVDEAHSLGAFPKPSLRTKELKKIFDKHDPMVIFLSGTPTPESYSQVYHQFWILGSRSPFSGYQNFYKWAKDYVIVTQRKINGFMINQYDNAIESKVKEAVTPFTISFTQQEAGFESSIEEEIIYCEKSPIIDKMCDLLNKNRVIEGNTGKVLLADTGAKLMQKIHQLYSGTAIFEDGESMVICHNKAQLIKSKFAGKKIGIFYKFKAEYNALVDVFGKENLTTDVHEFDNSDKSIALQIVSGREGVSLRNAEYLIFYNIDFSATSYWQARDRMTTKDRAYNKVYWVFYPGGIEEKIYKLVNEKKSYTTSHFKKDFLSSQADVI